jgi:hypothetical protein
MSVAQFSIKHRPRDTRSCLVSVALANSQVLPFSSFCTDDDSADDFADLSIFDGPYTWTDIVQGYRPLNADCTQRCLTCAPGCNPACCASAVPSKDSKDVPSSSTSRAPPRGLPLPPLACPCFCDPTCPPAIRDVCCTTPGTGLPPRAIPPEAPTVDSVNPQVPILQDITSGSQSQSFNPHRRIWGRPNRPLACPCFCDPKCPPYIQDACCTTPGTNAPAGGGGGLASRRTGIDKYGNEYQYEVVEAPKTRDSLSLIIQTGTGDVRSVLAAVGLDVFDSFITLNLVQGLNRASDITYNPALKGFEITMDVVFADKGKEDIPLAHTFAIIDGSGLMETEQILLGTGFLSRVGAISAK